MKTGHALALTLKDMMSKQPLETISVLELSKKCGISRKTFYYHYHDTYDLLTQVFLEEKIPGVNNATTLRRLMKTTFFTQIPRNQLPDFTLMDMAIPLFII